MNEKIFGLTSLTSTELSAVNGGGWWEDFKAGLQKDLQDAAEGWRDATATLG